MSSDIAIKVENLSKCYQIYDKPRDRLLQGIMPRLQRLTGKEPKQYCREFWALKDVSFEVKKGETVGIIGKNGSGKSTLLQMICGTLTPTSGSIQTNGRVAALLELGAGFNPEFTGRENVYMNAIILGLTREEVDACFNDIVLFAELGGFIEYPVKTYSSGMYVRLAFSVAIHTKPSILIVDEALSVGDARFQAKCLNHIKSMKSSGVSILFVSHDIGAVRTLCDRTAWLDSGQMKLIGEVFPITAHYTECLFGQETGFVENMNNEASMPQIERKSTTAEPISHWGPHVGAILDAAIVDIRGIKKHCFVENETMRICIVFRIPPYTNRSSLSIAFSIKSLSGDDLIVGETWPDINTFLPEQSNCYEVVFELENCLNSGEYLLVVAMEDRSGATIQYHEYIEGAQYFSTLFKKINSGRFIPRIRQNIQHIEGVKTSP